MNAGFRHCNLFVGALFLALGAVAIAAEPNTGESSADTSASSPPNPEAHGLLTRFWSPVPTKPVFQPQPDIQQELAAEQPILPGVGSLAFPSSNWNNRPISDSLAVASYNAADSTVTESLTSSTTAKGGGGDYYCCPDPLWCHRCGVFADLLYLRPGNIDYIYAVEQTGTLPTDSQTGPTGRVGFDAALGFRVGATQALSDCSSLQATYLWFQDDTQSTITAAPGNVLIFQPGLPAIPNVGASSITASSNYNIRFQQIDLDYRGLLYGTCDSAVNYFAGLRYANLKQDFSAQEDVGAPTGLTAVNSHISFDGFGIGFGLDGMRRSPNSGLLVYSRASASFVSGEFKANYRQTSQFVTGAIGNDLVDYRVLTILQTELGTGWQSACGHYRFTIGYQFAGWFNSLTTGSYIQGVQNRQFNNLNETITFDGLVTRFLYQF
jgi:Legionella pneumophila major outer membrane protein precursor